MIADGTIGRVAESATCAEKFEREGVGSTITVTSCWCYGAETMDMNPHYPKAVWGFNGTERPGAVYLAAVLAGHAQKGLPAFGIYGHDVQDIEDNTIPKDVAEKILQFARAAQAVATMRGKSYLSMGSVSMGIAGSIVNPDFFQEYLGMRCESVDLTEIIRRMTEGIYDKDEFEKAMAWTEKHCKKNEGHDYNIPEKVKTREQKDKDWEFIVKMTIIMRDLMTGNPKLRELGFKEELVADYEDEHYPIKSPSLVDVIKLRMYEMGLNQVKLSELLEVSPSRVSDYLTGRCEPTLKVAREISRKLNIDANIVLGI